MRFAFVLTAGLAALSLTAAAQKKAADPKKSEKPERAMPEMLPVGRNMPMADAPLFQVQTQKTTTLGAQMGPKGLLVMFSCNTCPYVVKSQARTREMIELAQSRELGVVVINSNEARRDDDDAPNKMVEYAAEQGYTIPYVIDPQSQVANAFGATRTPEVYLFDSSKRLLYKGAMEDNPASPGESTKLYLKTAIERMATGQSIDPASTRSIGCSIKRRES